MDTNVYYKTVFPGYVVQLFTPEQLVDYSSEYLKKYDAYDKNQDIELNRIRKNLMYRYINPRKLLDVGYGLGGFLDSVQLNDPRVELFGGHPARLAHLRALLDPRRRSDLHRSPRHRTSRAGPRLH